MVRKEDCVKIGYISKPHNLRGEVVIASDNDLLEQYVEKPVFILLDGAPVPFFISPEGVIVRNHNSYIVKFDDVDTLEAAKQLVGNDLLVDRQRAIAKNSETESCDIFNTIGFSVEDVQHKRTGYVTEISDYAGNMVMSVEFSGKEVLLPIADEYILEIDYKGQYIKVRIPEELIHLYE